VIIGSLAALLLGPLLLYFESTHRVPQLAARNSSTTGFGNQPHQSNRNAAKRSVAGRAMPAVPGHGTKNGAVGSELTIPDERQGKPEDKSLRSASHPVSKKSVSESNSGTTLASEANRASGPAAKAKNRSRDVERPVESMADASPGQTQATNTTKQLAEISKVTSLQYSEFGYADYRLGDTLDSVNKRAGNQLYTTKTGYVTDGSNILLWFDEGRLRVIKKTYEGNVSGYVEELVRLFGKSMPQDIYRTRTQSRVRVDSFHFFPSTIVCTSVVSVAGPSYASGPSNFVIVEVFDKAWLIEQFESFCSKVDVTLEWITLHVKPDDVQSVAMLPNLPNTQPTFSALGERNESKWAIHGEYSEIMLFKKQDNVFLLVERFNHHIVEPLDGVPSAGSFRVRVDFFNHPDGQSQILSLGALPLLSADVVSALAQARFPRDQFEAGKEFDPSTGIPFYTWRSKQGWTVEAGSDWLGLIADHIKL
jgi:hypothetical protein